MTYELLTLVLKIALAIMIGTFLFTRLCAVNQNRKEDDEAQIDALRKQADRSAKRRKRLALPDGLPKL